MFPDNGLLVHRVQKGFSSFFAGSACTSPGPRNAGSTLHPSCRHRKWLRVAPTSMHLKWPRPRLMSRVRVACSDESRKISVDGIFPIDKNRRLAPKPVKELGWHVVYHLVRIHPDWSAIRLPYRFVAQIGVPEAIVSASLAP